MARGKAIYVRGWFGAWQKADRKRALSFARTMYGGIAAGHTKEQKIIIVNEHLKGLTVTEEDLV